MTVQLNHLCLNLRPLVTYQAVSRPYEVSLIYFDRVSLIYCDQVSSSDSPIESSPLKLETPAILSGLYVGHFKVSINYCHQLSSSDPKTCAQGYLTHFTCDSQIHSSRPLKLEAPAFLSRLYVGHFRSISNTMTKCHPVTLKHVLKAT